jgi:hypothetical protein
MYEEYALLKQQIKILEDKATAMLPSIIADMQSRDVKKESHSLGNFSLSTTKKWIYPEALVIAKDKLDAKFEKAKSTGEATFEETPRLTFTGIKI